MLYFLMLPVDKIVKFFIIESGGFNLIWVLDYTWVLMNTGIYWCTNIARKHGIHVL